VTGLAERRKDMRFGEFEQSGHGTGPHLAKLRRHPLFGPTMRGEAVRRSERLP
jgi:hypothetical protein